MINDQQALAQLNSAAKYPSILTYHGLNPKDGRLVEAEVTEFPEQVILTEKINGTNGRIVITPGGDWFIGSREELLYAAGDRIENPALSIVSTLKPLAEKLAGSWPGQDKVSYVFFLEVYGHRIGGAAKQYTTVTDQTGYRLFDIATVPDEVLSWEREKISSWREHGGQSFLSEDQLTTTAAWENIELVPRLGTVNGADLPAGLAATERFLTSWLPSTRVALDASGGGRGEGIVLRSADRSVIAKARFEDYARTLTPPQRKGERS